MNYKLQQVGRLAKGKLPPHKTSGAYKQWTCIEAGLKGG